MIKSTNEINRGGKENRLKMERRTSTKHEESETGGQERERGETET